MPFSQTSPAVGTSARVMQRSSVVLPQPLPPSTISSSPACTSRSTSASASLPFG